MADRFVGECWECGEVGHQAKSCSKRSKRRNSSFICFNCGEVGHYRRDCNFKREREEGKASELPRQREKSLQAQERVEKEISLQAQERVEKEISLQAQERIEKEKSLQAQERVEREKSLQAQERVEREKSLQAQERVITERETPALQAHHSIDPPQEKEVTSDALEDPNSDITSPLPNFEDSLFTEERDKDSHHSQAPPLRSSRRKFKDTILYERIATHPHYLDTHCHLEYLLEKYRLSSFSALASRFSYPPNFDGCIVSFCDPAAFSSFGCCHELLSEDKVWASFGIHPHHSSFFSATLEDKLLECMSHPKCVALGEVGLDYSEHSLKQSSQLDQKQVLNRMLSYCVLFMKPVVLHCRSAEEDLFEILSASLPSHWFIHLHCYTGSIAMAEKFTSAFPNLYLGLTGHVTQYKFEESRQIVRNFPLNRFLIETDAPYMIPYSMRCRTLKWSHPPMAICVAEEIAKLKKCRLDEVIVATRENARTLYGI